MLSTDVPQSIMKKAFPWAAMCLILGITAVCLAPFAAAKDQKQCEEGANYTQYSNYSFTLDRESALIGKLESLGAFETDQELILAFQRWLPTVESEIFALNVERKPLVVDYAYIPYVSYSFNNGLDAELRLPAIRSGVTSAIYTVYSVDPYGLTELDKIADDLRSVTGIVTDGTQLQSGLLNASEKLTQSGGENYNIFYESTYGNASLLYTAINCFGDLYYSIQATSGVTA